MLHTIIRKLLVLFFFLPTQQIFSSSTFPFPIDIVYLWVDGNDSEWIAIKNSYLDGKTVDPYSDAASDNRFLDHEELRYSLRSIMKFAPFFNHIYIVTMNQKPKWLLEHPQVTIVDHKDIFINPDDLPTFNSQALECNLHRIPNLSEHFIYFNDDVFLGQISTPYDFFTEDGKLKVLFEKGLTVSPIPAVQATLYRKAWVNSSALLDEHFVPEPRKRLCHSAFALRKSLIKEVERLFPFVFNSNSSHKFRCPQDFNVTNGLFQYIWYYQGFIDRGSMTNRMVSIYNDDFVEDTITNLGSLLLEPPHTFCLQDCMSKNSQETNRILKDFFQTLLPTPAPWELVDVQLAEDSVQGFFQKYTCYD